METNVLLQYRGEYLRHKLQLLKNANSDDGTRKIAMERLDHFSEIMGKVITRERHELHLFRKKSEYDDDVIAFIEHRLDLEEEQLQRDKDGEN